MYHFLLLYQMYCISKLMQYMGSYKVHIYSWSVPYCNHPSSTVEPLYPYAVAVMCPGHKTKHCD